MRQPRERCRGLQSARASKRRSELRRVHDGHAAQRREGKRGMRSPCLAMGESPALWQGRRRALRTTAGSSGFESLRLSCSLLGHLDASGRRGERGAGGGSLRSGRGSWWSTVKVQPRRSAIPERGHPAKRARALSSSVHIELQLSSNSVRHRLQLLSTHEGYATQASDWTT